MQIWTYWVLNAKPFTLASWDPCKQAPLEVGSMSYFFPLFSSYSSHVALLVFQLCQVCLCLWIHPPPPCPWLKHFSLRDLGGFLSSFCKTLFYSGYFFKDNFSDFLLFLSYFPFLFFAHFSFFLIHTFIHYWVIHSLSLLNDTTELRRCILIYNKNEIYNNRGKAMENTRQSTGVMVLIFIKDGDYGISQK